MFTDTDQTIEQDGFTLTVTIMPDDHSGEPWCEEDGHGPVSDWTKRAKLPGELVLCDDGRNKRYCDFAAAVRLAKRDGWDCAPYGQGTVGERARRAATADYARLRGWCVDSWSYVGVVVTASRAGIELGRAALWGIESDAGDYLVETSNELINEALSDARAKLEALAS